MKKLVKVGLVVPVVLLVAVAVFGSSAMAADEAEGQAALNRDLNQALNDKDRDADREDVASVAPSSDTPSDADGGVVTTNDAGDTSSRDGRGERALDSGNRSGSGSATADRVARRGQQAPRGTTVAAYDDEKGKKGKDNNSGKSGGGSDENNDENDDDEDVTPSGPEPTK